MPKLHVVFRKEELDADRLPGKVVVVVDVLFATSTIVHAFGEGIDCIWPALDAVDAAGIAARLDAPMLAGEFLAEELPGFGPATPLALAGQGLRGATLVYATTNGTVALHNASAAAHVYVGALSNGAALAAHLAIEHPDDPVLLVCSGSLGRFNLEDFYGAGHLASHLEASGRYSLTDAALAALLFYRGCATDAALNGSRVGRMMQAHGLGEEIECAARLDVLDVVPKLSGGRLQRVQA